MGGSGAGNPNLFWLLFSIFELRIRRLGLGDNSFFSGLKWIPLRAWTLLLNTLVLLIEVRVICLRLFIPESLGQDERMVLKPRLIASLIA